MGSRLYSFLRVYESAKPQPTGDRPIGRAFLTRTAPKGRFSFREYTCYLTYEYVQFIGEPMS